MKTIRIFISSPGDVAEERDRARQVVEGLRRRYAGRLILKPVLWEDLPLQADMSFQQGIDLVLSADQGIDIGVFVLWSRLGSLQDGSKYRSGTEREFDLMLEARRQSGGARPSLLVYTRSDDASFGERLRGKSTTEQQELILQKAMAEQFITEKFQDTATGRNLRAHHSFDRPVTFSQRLRAHLTELLDELAGGGIAEAVWDIEKQGPPFLGLEAFQPEHADVFFGRDAETLEARHALREQARNGCAFLLLSGASGSGKSSLARAGVLPAIVENELDEQVAAWRAVIATPLELGTDPLAGLVRRLAASEVLPELHGDAETLDDLIEGMRHNPALTHRLRVKDAIARASKRQNGGVRVVLVLDQLEELFATASTNDAGRDEFLNAVETMARSGQVWVLATVRSDFWAQVQAQPALVRMTEGRGLLPVLPPEAGAMRQLIEEPARLADLTFETRDGQSLANRILKDAAAHAELLPLLEYVLRELFEQRTAQRTLTWEAYEKLGGVEGALAKRAEDVFKAQTVEAQEALGAVLKALVTIGQEGSDAGIDQVVRQRMPLTSFASSATATALVKAFVEERLLTTANDATTGQAVVTVAHESLLRVWPRAIAWAEQNRDFLRTRARIAARRREGSPLLEGDPLLEAAKAHLLLDPLAFDEAQRDFVKTALATAERKARRLASRRRLAFASLTLLTLATLIGAGIAWRQKGKADASAVAAREQQSLAQEQAQRAETALRASEKQLMRAHLEESKAWLERAGLAKEKREPLDTMVMAGRAIGFQGVGRPAHSDRFLTDFPLLAGGPFADPEQEATRRAIWAQARQVIAAVSQKGEWREALDAQHRFYVEDLCFSPDGTYLATCGGSSTGDDGEVYVWDFVSGRKVAAIPSPSWRPSCVRFVGHRDRLAVGAADGIQLWDLTSGAKLRTIDNGRFNRRSEFAISADGNQIAISPEGFEITLVNAETGVVSAKLNGHENEVTSMHFSPDGKRLASGSSDKTIRIWDLEKQVASSVLRGAQGKIARVRFTPAADRLASVSDGARSTPEVKIWDLKTGTATTAVTGKDATNNVFAFSPDGTCLAIGLDRNGVKLIDTESGSERATFAAEGTLRVDCVAFSPDGTYLVSSGMDKHIRIWDVASQAQVHRGPSGENSHRPETANSRWLAEVAGTDYYVAMAFSPDGLLLATGASDRMVRLWDARSGMETAQLKQNDRVESLSFSPDGQRLGIGLTDGSIHLWDIGSRKEVFAVRPHTIPVKALCFSPDGRIIASGDLAGVIVLSETAAGTLQRTLKGHEDGVNDLSFSPDGSRLASGSDDKTVSVWEVETGRRLDTMRDHEAKVEAVSFSPDGRTVGSISEGNSIRLWNWQTKTTRIVDAGNTINSLAFSPDASTLAIGTDRGAKMLDLGTATVFATLKTAQGDEASNSPIKRVCFDKDGRRMAFVRSGGRFSVGVTDVRQIAPPLGEWVDSRLVSFDGNAVRFEPNDSLYEKRTLDPLKVKKYGPQADVTNITGDALRIRDLKAHLLAKRWAEAHQLWSGFAASTAADSPVRVAYASMLAAAAIQASTASDSATLVTVLPSLEAVITPEIFGFSGVAEPLAKLGDALLETAQAGPTGEHFLQTWLGWRGGWVKVAKEAIAAAKAKDTPRGTVATTLARARALGEKMLQSDPENADGRSALVGVIEALIQEADQSLKKADDKNNQTANQQEKAKLRELLDRLVTLSPNDWLVKRRFALAYLDLAESKLAEEDFPAAREALAKALPAFRARANATYQTARVQRDVWALLVAGRTAYEKGDLSIAERQYSEAQKLIEASRKEGTASPALAFTAWANQVPVQLDGIRTKPAGIGALITPRNDGSLAIEKMVEGSPSALSGQIQPGDELIACGEGTDGDWRPAAGMAARDVVALIRGKEGTSVRLKLRNASGEYAVTLKRAMPRSSAPAVTKTVEQLYREQLEQEATGLARVEGDNLQAQREFIAALDASARLRLKTKEVNEAVAAMKEAVGAAERRYDDAPYVASQYLGLSWYQLLARDFAGAEATARRGLQIDANKVSLNTNLAHALLFQDKYAEAEALHLQHKEAKLGEETWMQVIADDFKKLREGGIDHADMKKIEALFSAALPAKPQP